MTPSPRSCSVWRPSPEARHDENCSSPPAGGRPTFDCFVRGPDPVGATSYLSQELGCQGVAIRCVPHTIGQPGIRDGRSGSVQFQLFGPLETDYINYVRSIVAAYDGSRWVFVSTGTEQDFEEPEAYRARRVRDRFTSEMLARYCRALGLDVFNPGAYGPGGVLVGQHVATREGIVVMNLAEAQEWLEIIPGMADRIPT